MKPNPDILFRMANDIGTFFISETNPDEAARSVLNHIRRYWDPRMRAQIVKQFQVSAAGLDDHVRAAIELLARGES